MTNGNINNIFNIISETIMNELSFFPGLIFYVNKVW